LDSKINEELENIFNV